VERKMADKFELVSDYEPKGDQPGAIEELVKGLKSKKKFLTLLGATGTGKTFTIANVVAQVNKPTLVMAPNKLLALQLYQEFKALFPKNAVHYYVSYFDYYRPEAYIPQTDHYLEKESDVNQEIQKFRLAATHSLLTRRDVLIVASVSCIFGIEDPKKWVYNIVKVEVGMQISRLDLIKKFVQIQYERNDLDFDRKNIRVKGDTIDIFPGYLDNFYRISFFGDEVEKIRELEPLSQKVVAELKSIFIFPAEEHTGVDIVSTGIKEQIEQELEESIKKFREQGKLVEAQRLEQRVNYDIEMVVANGFCNGIENYSRYLDGRQPGETPHTILDYFPEDYLMVLDESHLGVPQLHGMIGGFKSRIQTLIDYGFRLPSAYDNRPLTFEEWENKVNQVIFVSATPGDYELEKSGGYIDQVIRPTGLVDPEVEVRRSENQIDDLLAEIKKVIQLGHKVLITTMTKRLAESIAEYYKGLGLKIEYLHSDIDTVERMELIRKLRMGTIDIIVGINLLREGLDIPEVALVAILDADMQGFLRNTRSLIQTIGRASRNAEGRVILYANTMTQSMKEAIEETNRRRNKQLDYNKKHGITPKTIQKIIQESISDEKAYKEKEEREKKQSLEDLIERSTNTSDLITDLTEEMKKAAVELDFERAALLRDQIAKLKTNLGDPKDKS
jgi:excinuclease ABC subunit B